MILLDTINFPTLYLTPIINIFMPFLILFPFSIFLIYKLIIQKRKFSYLWRNLFFTFCVAIFTCISNIIYSLMNLMNCKEVTPKMFFLSSYLNEDCTGERYFRWLNYFIIPAFYFFAICLPAIALFFMFFKKRQILERKILVFGFLTNGYKRNKYYW